MPRLSAAQRQVLIAMAQSSNLIHFSVGDERDDFASAHILYVGATRTRVTLKDVDALLVAGWIAPYKHRKAWEITPAGRAALPPKERER